MNSTKIEWTERVWNPSIGCDKVSAGCKNCYAESFARRLQGAGIKEYQNGFTFTELPQRLDMPLKVKTPSRFFVNSNFDIFHDNVRHEFLDAIFDVIRRTPQHTYQILTKREKNMADYFRFRGTSVPENVWLGVSVENGTYRCRIDSLRQIDATIRFISFEPLIGRVGPLDLTGIHWAIVGGESGRRARPIKRQWVDEIYEQCVEQHVVFFFKQWGTWGADEVKRTKDANGRLYRNKYWNDYPGGSS
jgi:protein gp37